MRSTVFMGGSARLERPPDVHPLLAQVIGGPVLAGVLADAAEHRNEAALRGCDQSRCTHSAGTAWLLRARWRRNLSLRPGAPARRAVRPQAARVANTASMSVFLLPSRNSIVRYWCDWFEAGPST